MAYNLNQRFSSETKYYRLLDPGAYQHVSGSEMPLNKVPFLSKTPRRTTPGNKLWTHSIYNTNVPTIIPNCTALKSKQPRFPYEALTKEDLEKLLCQCGIQNTCICQMDENEMEEKEEIVCQGKIQRHIFKGAPPRSFLGEGLSTPSKQDHGFEILPNGSRKRITSETVHTQPPFYNTRVHESTSYYQGCKWSRWTSDRSSRIIQDSPGPTDYTFTKEATYEKHCAEKVRAHKRKTSKQLRFIEMVQRRNKHDNFPGPGSYDPKLPNGTDLQFLGPKAERFQNQDNKEEPGPADYRVKRNFELPTIPEKICHAKLSRSAPFGSKSIRLKLLREEGPSPASYELSPTKTCKFVHCPTTPFGTSTIRFKETLDNHKDESTNLEKLLIKGKSYTENICSLPTWEFRSQTIRMKPLLKKLNEPSPADLPQCTVKIERSIQLQSVAPFLTSEHRFRRWYNWIAVHGAENTPGPSYYCLEKSKCLPAVRFGPLTRSPRFGTIISQTPGPNEYNVGGGIENILITYNERLKDNIKKQNKFYWESRTNSEAYSFEEKESILLQKSIALLETNEIEKCSKTLNNDNNNLLDKEKPKLLRSFLVKKQMRKYF